MLHDFLINVQHNLFKPLLLFFYAGFLIPLLRIKFEFPKPLYQSVTIYLLLAIGWHGGEELASLSPEEFAQAFGFMIIGFFTNLVIGFVAYAALRMTTKLRQIDAATVAGYYGSDSAGTFVTCIGALVAANIAFAPYMPVMLAVMEIPGCLVALLLVSRLRRKGMDAAGNLADDHACSVVVSEASVESVPERRHTATVEAARTYASAQASVSKRERQAALVGAAATATLEPHSNGSTRHHLAAETQPDHASRAGVHVGHAASVDSRESAHAETARREAEEMEAMLALEPNQHEENPSEEGTGFLNPKILHEVFLNPGIFLLFAGIAIGFVSRLQGKSVTAADDLLFVELFQGVLCLFLLEMGVTASQKLKDLRTAGWRFVAFGLIAPNVFALSGMCVAHLYSLFLGEPFAVGTYALFGVLCGAASYIAVPAVQRIAIPEASPTLPLAASLGLTFSYNVTIGIPLYLMFATVLTTHFPVYA